MANFLYFLPGESNGSPAVIQSYGLGDRLGDGYTQGPGCRAALKGGQLCARGTEGGEEVHGTLVGVGATEHVRLQFDAQTWERVEEPDWPVWHLGWWTDEPPTAADLICDAPTNGYMIGLGNGEDWIVPAVRRYPEGTQLPATLRLEADGTEREQLHGKMRELFDEISGFAEAYYKEASHYIKGEEFQSEVPDLALGFYYRVLALNYRVGRPEINALGLLTNANRVVFALAVIDWPVFLNLIGAEDEAKKADAPPSAGTAEA